ncbi:MAG: hypothetical protein SW833_20330 [Cyanobacteriota bacterium]|nr:hypothetical protein [Cyanobacteriota bacterium]
MPDLPQPNPPFTEQGHYPCPVCGCGQISALSLMEAMSCNACDRLFIISVPQQSIALAESRRTLTWHWNGQTWQAFYRTMGLHSGDVVAVEDGC